MPNSMTKPTVSPGSKRDEEFSHTDEALSRTALLHERSKSLPEFSASPKSKAHRVAMSVHDPDVLRQQPATQLDMSHPDAKSGYVHVILLESYSLTTRYKHTFAHYQLKLPLCSLIDVSHVVTADALGPAPRR